MRWNGVFILGLGLTVLGFVAMVATHAFGPNHPFAAMLSVAILSCGAIVACLGTLLGRIGATKANANRKRLRLFGGPSSQNGTGGRAFGQREAYGKLPPKTQPRAETSIAFKQPGAPKPKPQSAPSLLAIEGPQ